jgi:hypothetical protein
MIILSLSEDRMMTAPIDVYYVSLDPKLEYERLAMVNATATNVADASCTVTATLSPAAAYDLLEFAYEAEQGLVLHQFEQLEAGQSLTVMSTDEDRCKFTTSDLIVFGFDAKRLRTIRKTLRRSAA